MSPESINKHYPNTRRKIGQRAFQGDSKRLVIDSDKEGHLIFDLSTDMTNMPDGLPVLLDCLLQ